MKPILLFFTLVLCLLPKMAISDTCFFNQGNYGNHKAVVNYQAATLVHPVYYAIGYPIQSQALKEEAKRIDPEYQEYLEFKAFKAGLKLGQQQYQQQEQKQQNSILSQKCASCHGLDNAAPKGGIHIDVGHALSSNQITESLRRIKSNDPSYKMPPSEELTPEEKGALMEELLNLDNN